MRIFCAFTTAAALLSLAPIGNSQIQITTEEHSREGHAAMVRWAGRFPAGGQEDYIFPACEDARLDCEKPSAGNIDPSRPIKTWRTAWRRALKDAKLQIRFHDLRHCCITKLAESQASEQTIMAIAGHLSREMLEHYSHIRMAAKRTALESIVKPSENIVFREGVNQNVHQLSIARSGLTTN